MTAALDARSVVAHDESRDETDRQAAGRSWLSAVSLLLLAATAHAQVRVNGRTLSDTAAPVAGASVAARTPASNAVVARATTDAAGAFVLELAATGDTVSASSGRDSTQSSTSW